MRRAQRDPLEANYRPCGRWGPLAQAGYAGWPSVRYQPRRRQERRGDRLATTITASWVGSWPASRRKETSTRSRGTRPTPGFSSKPLHNSCRVNGPGHRGTRSPDPVSLRRLTPAPPGGNPACSAGAAVVIPGKFRYSANNPQRNPTLASAAELADSGPGGASKNPRLRWRRGLPGVSSSSRRRRAIPDRSRLSSPLQRADRDRPGRESRSR